MCPLHTELRKQEAGGERAREERERRERAACAQARAFGSRRRVNTFAWVLRSGPSGFLLYYNTCASRPLAMAQISTDHGQWLIQVVIDYSQSLLCCVATDHGQWLIQVVIDYGMLCSY